MNERINELAKQATEDILGVKILNKDRFAELIVRECVCVSENHLSDEAAGYIRQAIKEHFGVE
jgi:hypothetical protein